MSITGVIKARNEGHQIEAAVTSLKLLADRVIVIDDGSTDDTADRARSAGADVFMKRSQNGRINELERYAFTLTDSEWLVRMDADERMTPTLASKLRELSGDERLAGVQYARRNYMFGEWPRHGGWFEAHHVGFFRRSAVDPAWTADLHSQVAVIGDVVTLPPTEAHSTQHFDYDSVEQFATRTLSRYAAIEARERIAEGARFSPVRLFVRPWIRFWGRLLVRRGYRDGTRGLVLAALLGVYDVMIELNTWDLTRTSDHDTGSQGPSSA